MALRMELAHLVTALVSQSLLASAPSVSTSPSL